MLVQDTYQEPQDTSELDETAQQAWSEVLIQLSAVKSAINNTGKIIAKRQKRKFTTYQNQIFQNDMPI